VHLLAPVQGVNIQGFKLLEGQATMPDGLQTLELSSENLTDNSLLAVGNSSPRPNSHARSHSRTENLEIPGESHNCAGMLEFVRFPAHAQLL
jgi:hypothetical protein